ncbi:MAG: sigma-70 family RNA polymerase sigma factor [Caulobacteraceae bacterium]
MTGPNHKIGTILEAEFKALMIAAQAGDAAAQRRLLTLLAGRLRAFFARRMTKGADGVEDLVQEALLAIHVKRATYDPKFDFTPWAFAIARYKLIDHFRRQGRRLNIPLDEAGELLSSDNPEEGAVRRDVATLLARLPSRQRALMRDVKLEGYSMEEAAGRAGMSVTAAKVSVHRGMKRLSNEVKDEDL